MIKCINEKPYSHNFLFRVRPVRREDHTFKQESINQGITNEEQEGTVDHYISIYVQTQCLNIGTCELKIFQYISLKFMI